MSETSSLNLNQVSMPVKPITPAKKKVKKWKIIPRRLAVAKRKKEKCSRASIR